MRYVVIGGAGRTGSRVAEVLRERGHDVVAASRRTGADLAKGIDPALLDGAAGVVVSVEPPADDAGADAVMNRGIADLARVAAGQDVPVVLVSQIYITRADEHPEMGGIIRARARGEQALRASGAAYTILRPSWLTSGPAGGVRLEQGDAGEGWVSRDTVAEAAVAALTSLSARGKTFELYDAGSGAEAPDWPVLFAGLATD